MNNKVKQKKLLFLILIIIGLFFYIKKTYINNIINDLTTNKPNQNYNSNQKKNITERQLTFLIFKQEKRLELQLKSDTGTILTQFYDINVNEEIGPKLFNRDGYFPEGRYSVTEISKNNLKFNFPNSFDLSKAKADNRPLTTEKISLYETNSNNLSLLKKEDFVTIIELIQKEQIQDIQLISTPIDFRKQQLLPYCHHCPHWINELYSQLELEIKQFTISKINQENN